MKRLLLFSAGLAFSILSFAQMDIPFQESFEAYMVDQQLVEQATSTVWDTWSSDPGSGEDAFVTSEKASDGTKSLKIDNGNDMVLLFGDLASGRIEASFKLFVPSGKLGYFNIIQRFEANNYKWAFETYLKDGICQIEKNGIVGEHSYKKDGWSRFKVVVDLDMDWTEIYVQGDLIAQFEFALGTDGEESLKQLAAINFYAWDDDGSGIPGMYVDEIAINYLPTPYPATNLQAIVENTNDIQLSWEAPTEGVPDYYSVIRNNELLETNITGLNYADTNVYPMDYTYTVKAYYEGNGSSPGSNEAQVAFDIGVDRKAVLLEIATGTWAEYAVGVAKGATDLIDNGKNIAVIGYHASSATAGDVFERMDGLSRLQGYGINEFPTSIFDGNTVLAGGSKTVSTYDRFLPVYENLINIPSIIDLDLVLGESATHDFTGSIEVTKLFDYFDEVFVNVAIVENNIEESWLGQGTVENVFLQNIYEGNFEGQAVDFSSSATQKFDIDFTVNAFSNLANCEVIAYVQDVQSNKIVQAAIMPLPYISNVAYKVARELKIYPNPVKGVVNIAGFNALDKVEIFNAAGQLVYCATPNASQTISIEVNDFKKGMYTVKVTSKEGVKTSKFVK
jgi:hypothetical protein